MKTDFTYLCRFYSYIHLNTQVQPKLPSFTVQPIAFASMCFSDAEKNYSTVDRELAGLRWGIKHFKPFLYGVDFVVKTDHQPLVYLHNMKLVDARIARTLEDLSDFNFIIEYVPGKQNVIADGLSRIARDKKVEYDVGEVGLPVGLQLCGTPVAGGGDSLFESLVRAMQALDGEVISAKVLREKCMDLVMSNPGDYGFKATRMERKEFRRMRQEGQLPCIEVALAVSSLFKVEIHIYYGNQLPVVFRHKDVQENNHRILYIQCLAGIHYNPLLKNSNFKEPVIELNNSEKVVSRSINVAKVTSYTCKSCGPSDHVRIAISTNNATGCAIVDTGAEVSLIRKSAVQRSGVLQDMNNSHVQVKGFTGKEGNIMGEIALACKVPGLIIGEMHKFLGS